MPSAAWSPRCGLPRPPRRSAPRPGPTARLQTRGPPPRPPARVARGGRRDAGADSLPPAGVLQGLVAAEDGETRRGTGDLHLRSPALRARLAARPLLLCLQTCLGQTLTRSGLVVIVTRLTAGPATAGRKEPTGRGVAAARPGPRTGAGGGLAREPALPPASSRAPRERGAAGSGCRHLSPASGALQRSREGAHGKS